MDIDRLRRLAGLNESAMSESPDDKVQLDYEALMSDLNGPEDDYNDDDDEASAPATRITVPAGYYEAWVIGNKGFTRGNKVIPALKYYDRGQYSHKNVRIKAPTGGVLYEGNVYVWTEKYGHFMISETEL